MMSQDTEVIGINFVCLGNICRSPTAEGIMHVLVREAGLADRFRIDSSGTGAYHVGERADMRSRATALARGVDLASVSRRFDPAADFDQFHYIVAMDHRNLKDLTAWARNDADRKKLSLLRSHATSPQNDLSVPDPYYDDGFDFVFDVCMEGCRGLMDALIERHQLAKR
jgi:protein-tyrosine phosphatase